MSVRASVETALAGVSDTVSAVGEIGSVGQNGTVETVTVGRGGVTVIARRRGKTARAGQREQDTIGTIRGWNVRIHAPIIECHRGKPVSTLLSARLLRKAGGRTE